MDYHFKQVGGNDKVDEAWHVEWTWHTRLTVVSYMCMSVQHTSSSLRSGLKRNFSSSVSWTTNGTLKASCFHSEKSELVGYEKLAILE